MKNRRYMVLMETILSISVVTMRYVKFQYNLYQCEIYICDPQDFSFCLSFVFKKIELKKMLTVLFKNVFE